MARPAIKVEGARQLRAAMKRAGIDVQDLKDAHQKIAQRVVDAADATAPRRTGRLAADVRAAGTQSAAIVRLGRKKVPYAGPIHWGWAKRGIKPNPWVWNAAQAEYDASQDIVLDALEKIIATVERTATP